jgi:hypothetical protein
VCPVATALSMFWSQRLNVSQDGLFLTLVSRRHSNLTVQFRKAAVFGQRFSIRLFFCHPQQWSLVIKVSNHFDRQTDVVTFGLVILCLHIPHEAKRTL